jgi:hypothetical protein
MMLSIRSSIDSISSRLSGEKRLPTPGYYCKMNPQEQNIWRIIVSIPRVFFAFHAYIHPSLFYQFVPFVNSNP